MLLPGAAHPNRPMSQAVLARRYGLDPDTVTAWCDQGLPVQADGRVDPFAVCNWITWNRLAECPALARAWRGYLLVFAGFLGGDHAERWVRWSRGHALHLPGEATHIDWWIPRPAERPWQAVLAEESLGVDDRGHWLIQRCATGALPTIAGTVDLRLIPRPTIADAEVTSLVIELAGEFHYEYRHHSTGEALELRSLSGSCFDCVREMAARLTLAGRNNCIVSGMIVHDAFANPHFWLEVESTGGAWLPVDPSLPSIARMLHADWRAVAQAYTGGCDARRVQFAAQPISEAIGGPTVASLIGEATVDGENGWACMDWVCGDCSAEFTAL